MSESEERRESVGKVLTTQTPMINRMDEMTQETEEINNNIHRRRRTADG